MSLKGNHPAPPDPVMVLSASDTVNCLTFDPKDKDILFSGHQNGLIKEWNSLIQRTKCSWSGHSDSVVSLIVTGTYLISQGREGQIKFWSQENGQSGWKLRNKIASASLIFCNSVHLQFNNSSYLAIPTDQTAGIQIFQVVRGNTNSDTTKSGCICSLKSTLEPTPVKEYGMCMRMCSPEMTQNLIVGYESGIIALWDADKGTRLADCRIHEESVMCLDSIMDIETDSIVGVSGSADKKIHRWRIKNAEILKCQSVEATNAGFCDIKIRKDGRIFVSGGWDNASRIFTMKKLKPLAVLSYHKQSVQCVTFSEDKTIVTGSKDGYIAFWDVYKSS